MDNCIDNKNVESIIDKFNPFSLFNYYICYKFFNTSHKFLNKMVDKNLANYGTSFIHSSSFCLFSFLYYILENSNKNSRCSNVDNPNSLFSNFWDFIKVYSTGYFLYDCLFIVKHQKLSFVNCVYLYHHLSSINLLRDITIKNEVFKMILFAELSNLPSSIVYYLIKSKTKNKAFLMFMKKFQFVLYSFFRIPVITYYLFVSLKKNPYNKNAYISFPIYIMGLVWSSKLYKGLSK
tara:strand:- start:602 stop:1306 length:705 start_codon:yes stop_codon:yes gene_type:complete